MAIVKMNFYILAIQTLQAHICSWRGHMVPKPSSGKNARGFVDENAGNYWCE